MHTNPAVQAGCVDCHGGTASVFTPAGTAPGSAAYEQAKTQAHVQPHFPHAWRSSANPEESYTLLLKESPEFVRFINPGDLRIAQEACGQCHAKEVMQVRASLHTTSGVFWTAAAYNNGIWPFKTPVFGESYSREGVQQSITMKPPPTEAERRKGVVPLILPLPRWEILQPGDVFRVFEDGGMLISPLFPDLGNPQPDDTGGKPDLRQSIRGLGTGLRISVPILNVHKTRLNDPHLSFLGTNDHPGDYRSSGCTACHTVYANDRDPWNSGPYAQYGNGGLSATKDPTIPKNEPGHPIRHELTRSIPTSQCIVCHMHQPNVFVNPFLGYQMWDYETDGELMWPKEARHPSDAELFKSLEHNPEEAAARGLWNSGLMKALEAGSIGVLSVAATCAAAGLIVGVVTLTGLGLKFSSIVLQYADGGSRGIYDGLVAIGAAATPDLLHDVKLLLTAIFTSLIVWVVGLAVPVTASYIICAVIAAPALIKLGVPDFAAHMFIFYYAVLSEVSPPTALSPFAAAAITGGDPYRTTLQSWKYTLPAFLVPFMFVLDPSGVGLLLTGSIKTLGNADWGSIALVTVTAALGIAALAGGVQGWLFGRTTWYEKWMLIAAGLALVYPTTTADMVGFGLFALVVVLQLLRGRVARSTT